MARRKKMSSLQTGFRSNKISELLGNSKRRSFTSAEISALALGQDLTSNNKFRKSSKRTGLSAGEVSDYYSQGGGETPDQLANTLEARVGTDSGTYEADSCLVSQLGLLDDRDFLESLSFVLTANGSKLNKLYAAIPSDGSGDLAFTRASTRSRIGASLVESVATGVPAIDYANKDCPAIALEPARTNLLLRSKEIDNASWTKVAGTPTANTIAGPDGATTADSFLETVTNAVHLYRQDITKAASAIQYTFSVTAKYLGRDWVRLACTSGANGYSQWFNVALGTKGSSQIAGSGFTFDGAAVEELPDGWFKLSMTVTTDTTTTLRVNVSPTTANLVSSAYAGDITKGIYVSDHQLEVGAYATSNIPTTTGAVAREADAITQKTGVATLIGQTEGVLTFKGSAIADSTVKNAIWVSDGTDQNGIGIVFHSDNAIHAKVIAGGVTQADITGVTFLSKTIYNVVLTYQDDKVALFIDDVKLGEDLTVTIPACSVIAVASGPDGADPFYGRIERTCISKTALSDAAAEAVSVPEGLTLTFHDFVTRNPPTRYGSDAILVNDGTYENTCPGGIITDPLDERKWLFYRGEFLGSISVGARVSLFIGDKADPYSLGTTQGVILQGSESYDIEGSRFGCVVENGGTIYMYYVGIDASYDWRICLQTSTDGGRTFTKQGIVLDFNDVDEKSVSDPSVVIENGVWYMIYTGWDGLTSPANNNPGESKIGIKLATSNDGITWTKTDTILVPLGAGGTFDDNNVEGGELRKYGDTWIIMYNANDGTTWSIGLAYSETIDAAFTKYPFKYFQVAASGWDATAVAVPMIFNFGNKEVMYYQGGIVAGAIDVGAADLKIT